MKKIFIIISLLFNLIFIALGQEIHQAKFFSLKIPVGLSKLNIKSQIDNTQQEYNSIEKKMRLGSLAQEKFIGSGVVKYLQYNSGEFNSKNNYLEERKQALYNLFTAGGTKPLPEGYSSIIKKFDNCEALIIKHEVDEYIKYSIFTIDKAHSKYFNATIVAFKKDSIAGNKSVDDFIAGIKFK